jgi:predicted transcriptional regulator
MSNLFDRLQGEIEARNSSAGLSPIDLLDMPTALAEVVNHIVRNNGMRLEDVAAELNQPIEEASKTLDALVEKGYIRRVEVKGHIWYKAYFGKKADKTLSTGIWSALGDMMNDTK